MSVGQVIAGVLPRPRRRITWRAALPLALFLAVFAAVCVGLQARGVLLFTAPRAFLLLAFVPWLWWMHTAGFSGLSGVRAFAAVMVRMLLAGGLIMLMAEPRAVRRSDVLSVVYALDVSYSMGQEASDRALTFMLDTQGGKPPKDEAGLVVFGRDAAVELPPRTSFPFEQGNVTVTSRLERDGTNLEKALSLAAAVLPRDNDGRVVLISDGAATEGDLQAALEELKSRGIPVDVLPIQYTYTDEVWLEKIDLPRSVRAGETYEAAVVLSSLTAGEGTLRLYENGQLVLEDPVTYQAGKNRYVLPFYLRRPGYYEYEAVIEAPPGRDGWKENNKVIGHVFLKGESKILLVSDPQGDPEDGRPLRAALEEGKVVVEQAPAFQVPGDQLALLPYNAVVLVNVPADALDAPQMQALRDAVYHQGVGLLMVGGKNSFGPGGYHRTPIEEALPVDMDISAKKVVPKGALAIILHTCEFPEGNTWAKRITKEAIRVLSGQDEVGVLAYTYQGEGWIFPLTPASQYMALVQKINSAEPGDMPAFGPTMQMGLDALKASDAALKHMIIISDGDPQPPTPELLKQYQEAGISVSTVAINPHQGDVRVLQSIAQATGGRFYFPQDPRLLPSIFVKEAKTLQRNMIQVKDFVPVITAPWSDIVKGMDAAPALHGYVLTSLKGRATLVLDNPEKDESNPVLAVWRHGMGTAAAFTSDLTTNWARDWVAWDRYQAFVKQLILHISRAEKPGNLELQTYASGGAGVISVEDVAPEERFLQMGAAVMGPHDRNENVTLQQVGPRRYEGRFNLWGQGRYQVAVIGQGAGEPEQAVGGFVLPYSAEFLRFRADPIALNEISQYTGGRILKGNETSGDIFVPQRRPHSTDQPLTDVFLLLVACLVPLDVAVRRVQPDLALIRHWLGLHRKVESEKTLAALLRRKRAIEFVKPADRAGAPLPPSRPKGGPPTAPPPRPPPPAPLPEAEERTTGRLLAKKKKWTDRKQDEGSKGGGSPSPPAPLPGGEGSEETT